MYMVKEPKKKIKRVLVVDDHASGQELMAFIFRDLGYHYESALNGKEAVKKALAKDFDLILMDLRMPVMTGIEATQKIREVKKNLPIFAFTAHVMHEVSSKCKAVGMTGLIPKPLDVDQFKKWIQGRPPRDLFLLR